jgi:hypothetical protein
VKAVRICSSLLALAFFLSGVARAETPEQAADRLFKEAEVAASAGRYVEACPKLEESQHLDPGIGTEFNLADCYEHVGKVARAYQLFEDVAKIARASGKVERANASAARVAALEARVPRVRVIADAPVPGLVVSVDGEVIAIGAARAVEAGDHTVEASAPGRLPWRKVARVSPGAKIDVAVPPLDVVPPPSAPPPSGLGTQRAIGLGVGAAGAVAAITGAVAGGLSLAWHGSADKDCPDARCPASNPGFDTWHKAVVAGDVSTVAFVAAGGLLAAAAVLWFTAPKGKSVTVGLLRPALEGRF